VGNEFPDLSFTLPDQNNFKLKDVQKKYTLLEFWASWCGPCRQGFPSLISIYENNKSQFEVIGVSIDNKPSNWKKAMAEEQLPWINILDSEQKEKLKEKFKIKSIPHNMLINEDGMIEAIDIKIDQLNAILN
jgi:thiol-disulfide isomerase/thioredoxin